MQIKMFEDGKQKIHMENFTCKCGGELTLKDGYYFCADCRSKWILDRSEEGISFLYNKIEKKRIETGRITPKATQIPNSILSVKEIHLHEDSEAEIFKNVFDKTKEEALRVIITYLNTSQWESAMLEINSALSKMPLCPEILWYRLWCEKKASNEQELLKKVYTAFEQYDAIQVDKIISNATPQFAKHIVDLLLKNGASNDNSYYNRLSVVLPYAKNELIYTEQEFNEKVEKAYGIVNSNKFCRSFEYLIENTTESYAVDKYINCLFRFAKSCDARTARKYLIMILDVDKGNTDVYRKLVKDDLSYYTSIDTKIKDLEGLLSYSVEPEKQIEELILYIVSRDKTDRYISEFLMRLLEYHQNAPECFQKEMIRYAKLLLSSSLFGEARYWCNLVLSFNNKCRDAWLLVCLAKAEAVSDDTRTIINCKKNIGDCREFNKFLSLCPDETERKKYAELPKKQKQKKEKIKKIKICAILSCIVIIVFIFGVSMIDNAKYSVGNIGMIISAKKGDSYALKIEVANRSLLDIKSLVGVLDVYNLENENIVSNRVTLSGDIKSNKKLSFDVDLNTDSGEFYYLNYGDIWATFQIEQIQYSNNVVKEYQSKAKTILELRKNSNGTTDAENKYINAKNLYEDNYYFEALELFNTLQYYKDSAEYISKCQIKIKELCYNEAISLYNSGKYGEAINAFYDIYDYKDSANKIKEVIAKAETEARNFAAKGDYSKAFESLSNLNCYSYDRYDTNYLEIYAAYYYAKEHNYADAVLCGLTELIIENGVKSIPDGYFKKSKLVKITLPSTVKLVGASAFSDCESLEEIIMSNGTSEIGENAFCRCISLKKATLPQSLKTISASAFSGCKSLLSITIPNNVSFIGAYAFSGCTSLKNVIIGNGVKEISNNTFMECTSLTEVALPDSITSIGREAFYKCSSIKNITLPKNLISIGKSAFYSCSKIEYITIPENVNQINVAAFNYCTGMKKFQFENTNGWDLGRGIIDVSDATKNAKYINDSSYYTYIWTRK